MNKSRVPRSEAEQIVTTVRKGGTPVAFVERCLPGEGIP
jgi:hypothetical protein